MPFRGLFSRLSTLIKNAIAFTRRSIAHSIRLQLIVAFALCMIASVFVSSNFYKVFNEQRASFDYSRSMANIEWRARSLTTELVDDNRNFSLADSDPLASYLNEEARWGGGLTILLTDLDGKVLLRTANASTTEVDVHGVIKNAMDARIGANDGSRKEFFSFYPINLNGEKLYLVVSGIPQAQIVYAKYNNGGPLPFLAGVGTFFTLFILLTRSRMRYIEELASGLKEIAKGHLSTRVNERGVDELGSLARNMNQMAEELGAKIEEERRAEQTKTELITNVSHDLRTPLTSIMGYLRLLKDGKYESADQQQDYIDIAYGKSEKLKGLVEDLFEYTKLSNSGSTLKSSRVCLNELLGQLIEELVPVAINHSLTFEKHIPLYKVWVDVDADKMARVIENLLVNAIRYSKSPAQIQVKLTARDHNAVISITNDGEHIPQAELDRVFDRFYRVEKSRSSDTGGLGLGLAIAKSIVELHNGRIYATCEGEEITFTVELDIA